MSMKLQAGFFTGEMLLRIGSYLKPGYSEKQWIEERLLCQLPKSL